ncbi:SGNH/GDSL hydrolase family protein [Steroidobacter sp. S1-65]|uniref:SGNH/GDSL hydrolase family protein n=1 Tax=Steroidobacter gossypii TaxID=2805490 RepID=A0ABS1WZS7_9GAMM|nr:GDSL-type esterase/lipase family protein [Steroidobacter gossypii]MBM0106468.1 SGNH/GDSL hydrolase family protein [Steroidobacter gossypii]
MGGDIVLLGDSIFDNAAYTAGEPDVLGHLRSMLPTGWRASLRALDGARIPQLREQLSRLPGETTHLVVSIGGNDVLGNTDLLSTAMSSTTLWSLFAERVDAFESAYRAAIEHVLTLDKAITLCTIYNGNLDAAIAPAARLALTMFNDVILRTAFERSIGLIELRLVCTQPADYANPIEPSGIGGRKIAQAIVAAVGIDTGAGIASRVTALRVDASP